jgi:uncharacterized Zn ribbon protein
MKLVPVSAILFLVFCSGLAEAGHQINPTDDEGINEALEAGGLVYLNAGVYEINGPIVIGSDTILTGDPNAIIRVSSRSSQWFTGTTGIISCKESVKNVEIYGFQIDGNCANLPASYANTPGHDKDCEKLIILHGNSGDFADDIKVHDMKLYNSFSDGTYIYYAKNVQCYNNFISNCQHEGIFWSVVLNGEMYNNKIAGITSDCARLDNSINCRVYDNIFFSYDGDKTNGAYKHGENGIQVGDAGSSHGYDASNKPTTTTNIEIFDNTFANNGLAAIAGSGGENVYIHDNKFIGVAELETMGISVDGIPTKENSEKVFNSIFDILKTEISETGNVTQETITPVDPVWEKKGNAEAFIYLAGYDGEITIGNETYIPESPSKCARVLTDTHNLAKMPVNQASSVQLKDGENNSLVVNLEVKTKSQIKEHKTLLGIRIPSYKMKSEHESFTQTFPAPPIFPVITPPKAYVTYYNGSHATVYIPDIPGIVKTEISMNDSYAREYRLIGEVGTAQNGFKSARFIEVSTWKFIGTQMSRSQSGLHIKEPFNIDNLTISVTTPYKTMQVTDIDYVVIEDESSKIFNLGLLTIAVLCLTYGRAIYKILNMVVRKWF